MQLRKKDSYNVVRSCAYIAEVWECVSFTFEVEFEVQYLSFAGCESFTVKPSRIGRDI